MDLTDSTYGPGENRRAIRPKSAAMFGAERRCELPNDIVHSCQPADYGSGEVMEPIVERIAVVDEDGLRLFVEKRAIHVSRTKLRRMHNMEMYHLSTGELINFVGANEFIVAATGMRLSSRN